MRYTFVMATKKQVSEMTNEELWALFPIILKPHSDRYAAQYMREAQNLTSLLGKRILRMHHYGSTAVPGLLAKPTVDILMEIEKDTDLAALIQTLKSNNYEYAPQPQNPQPHMMFMKGYTPEGFAPEVFHLHVRYLGDHDELYFRDYLQEHIVAAQAYGELKQKLITDYEHDRDAYTEAKSAFIRKITKKARAAYPGRYKK